MNSLLKGVKTPKSCLFITPALKDRVSNILYLDKYSIFTPSFRAGCENRKKRDSRLPHLNNIVGGGQVSQLNLFGADLSL
jgi:hypothetical protein